ncbi:MAG: site-2 protease family protein [Cyanobacteria bacterium J06554_6]
MQWAALLHNNTQQVYALVTPSQAAVASTGLSFTSVFAEGGWLTTVNQRIYGIFSTDASHVVQYDTQATVAELLEIHRRQTAEIAQGLPVQALTVDAYTDAYNQFVQREAERWVQQREVYWVTPQVSYRLSLRTAFRAVFKVLTGMAADTFTHSTPSSNSNPPEPETASTAERVNRDLAAFQQLQKQSLSQPSSRRTRGWLFLATLACFVAVYATQLTPQSLVIFLLVLLLHEGGHLPAMRLSGYQQAGILFIPFLGALATARKSDASLSEKVWISLAGPLPGIAIALVLSIGVSQGWIGQSSWVGEAVTVLIGLNLFNLLPIYPLDGGQVADLLLFSRSPYLGVVFKLIGVGALMLLGLFTQAPLLFSFALLIALTIPTSFRLAKLSRQLHRSVTQATQATNETVDTETSARLALQQMQQPEYQRLTTQQKHTLVQGILDSRKDASAPLISRWGLTSVYVTSLVLSIVLGGWAIWLVPFSDTSFAEDLSQPEQAQIEPASIPYACDMTSPAVADDNPLMQDRQQTVIATFENRTLAQQSLTNLKSRLEPTDSAFLAGQTVFVSTFNHRTSTQTAQYFTDAKAQVLVQDPVEGLHPSLRMTATAADRQQAEQLAKELTDFFTLAVSFNGLVPPWSNTFSVTPEQGRARHTYAELLAIQDEAFELVGTPGFSFFWSIAAMLTGNPQWAAGSAERWQTQTNQTVREAAQSLLDEDGGDTLDVEVVALFLEELDVQQAQISQLYENYDNLSESDASDGESYQAAAERSQVAIQRVQDQIRHRLGALSPSQLAEESADNREWDASGDPDHWLDGDVYQSGAQISIEGLMSSQTHAILPEIAQYLCRQRFTQVQYDFTDPADTWLAESD